MGKAPALLRVRVYEDSFLYRSVPAKNLAKKWASYRVLKKLWSRHWSDHNCQMQSVGLPQAQDHCWARRGWKKSILQDVFRVYYTNEDLYCPFRRYWGAGWDGCGRGTSDDVCYLWNTSAIRRWSRSLGLFFHCNIYIYASVAGMSWSMKGCGCRSYGVICKRASRTH